MPETATGYGLTNPFDARAAIDAQARLMRDLLRQFGSLPLALAAYNAGAGRVAACFCIPPFAETPGLHRAHPRAHGRRRGRHRRRPLGPAGGVDM